MRQITGTGQADLYSRTWVNAEHVAAYHEHSVLTWPSIRLGTGEEHTTSAVRIGYRTGGCRGFGSCGIYVAHFDERLGWFHSGNLTIHFRRRIWSSGDIHHPEVQMRQCLRKRRAVRGFFHSARDVFKDNVCILVQFHWTLVLAARLRYCTTLADLQVKVDSNLCKKKYVGYE